MGVSSNSAPTSTSDHGENNPTRGRKKLPKMDLLSKSDPYLCVFIETESSAYKFVSRTEFVKNNCNPVWNPLEVEDEELDVNRDEIRLKLEVLDYDGKKKAEYMCSTEVTLGQLKSGGVVELTDREKRPKGVLNVN